MADHGDKRSALLRASTPVAPEVFRKLVYANHILDLKAIVDAYGHVSVRNPQNPATFFLSKSQAPALVSGKEDVQEYRVEDASPVEENAAKGYVERFIHSEIYKSFKGVNSVVHAHSEAVIPFGITSVPLRPVFHMGAVVGAQAPIYDANLHYKSTDTHNNLIANVALGASLAAAFAPATTLAKTTNLIKNYITASSFSTASPPPDVPPHPVVLMRGHGFTCVGTSIEEAVYRAVFTVVNARVQTQALLMQGSYNVGLVAEHFGKWDRVKDGTGGGPQGQAKQEGLKFLTDREVKESKTTGMDRCWELWCAEVEDRSLYNNEMVERGETGS